MSGRRGRSVRGFTLLELLVVIALVAIVGAAVSLSVGLPRAYRLGDEAARLAAAAGTARLTAALSQATVALEVDGQGYHFLRRGAAGWQTAGVALPAHRFPPGVTARVESSPAMIFAPDGDARVHPIRLQDESARETLEVADGGAGVIVRPGPRR